jgi:hypothetical protein
MDKMTGAEMAQGRYRTPYEISMNYLGVRRRSVGGRLSAVPSSDTGT